MLFDANIPFIKIQIILVAKKTKLFNTVDVVVVFTSFKMKKKLNLFVEWDNLIQRKLSMEKLRIDKYFMVYDFNRYA